jgi:DNA invertase Pin-like site-specific DNA recombinase
MGIPPHIVGHMNNLQILTKDENIKKSNNCDSIPIFIQQYMLGITKEKLDYEATQRKKKGIEMAKSRGAYTGRKCGSKETLENFISKPKNKIAIELLKEGKLKKAAIARLIGVHVNTITKLAKVIKENNL